MPKKNTRRPSRQNSTPVQPIPAKLNTLELVDAITLRLHHLAAVSDLVSTVADQLKPEDDRSVFGGLEFLAGRFSHEINEIRDDVLTLFEAMSAALDGCGQPYKLVAHNPVGEQ